MKSNLFKKATALGVAASMLVSTSAFATTTMTEVSDLTKGSTATGTGTIVAPTYKVKIPTSLGFAVDPYELSPLATGSALNPRSAIKVPGYGYAISNQSNIAVSVDVETTLTQVANVFVVPSNGAVNTYTTLTDSSLVGITTDSGAVVLDPTNKEKEISLFMLIAKTGTLSTTTALFAQPAIATYVKEGAVEVNVPGSTEKPARATFLLDKGIVGTDGKPKNPVELNMASTASGIFSFQGDINQYAPWAAADIKIAVKYTFSPVPESKKLELADGGSGYDTERKAVLVGTAGSSGVEFIAPETPTLSFGAASKATPADVAGTVDAGAGYRELINDGYSGALTVKIVGPTTIPLAATDFEVSALTGLNIRTSGITKIKAWPVGTYKVEYTTKNGRTVKGDLVLGA